MAKAKLIKKPKSVVRLVRKSNDLVEAKYKLDIWETRIFTKMVTMIWFLPTVMVNKTSYTLGMAKESFQNQPSTVLAKMRLAALW